MKEVLYKASVKREKNKTKDKHIPIPNFQIKILF